MGLFRFSFFVLVVLCLAETRLLKTNSRAQSLRQYSKQILNQLNIYRKHQHFTPYIKWDKILSISAGKEANSIIQTNSFGQHKNFFNWKKSFENKYFTEMTMIVDTEGKIPRQRAFAKAIVEALQKEQSWFLVHGYTIGGIAIKPIPKKKNNYIIVIHLAKAPKEQSLQNIFKKLKKGYKTKSVVKTKKTVPVVRKVIKKRIIKTKPKIVHQTQAKKIYKISKVPGKKQVIKKGKVRTTRKVITKRIIRKGKPVIIRRIITKRIIIVKGKPRVLKRVIKKITIRKGKPRIIRKIIKRRVIRRGKPIIVKKVIKRRVVKKSK